MARLPPSLAGLALTLAVVATVSGGAPAARAQTDPAGSQRAALPQGAGPGQIFPGRGKAFGASPVVQGAPGFVEPVPPPRAGTPGVPVQDKHPAQGPVAGPGQIPMQAVVTGPGPGQTPEQGPAAARGDVQAGRRRAPDPAADPTPAAQQPTPQAIRQPYIPRDRRPPPMQPFEVQRAAARQQAAEGRQPPTRERPLQMQGARQPPIQVIQQQQAMQRRMQVQQTLRQRAAPALRPPPPQAARCPPGRPCR